MALKMGLASLVTLALFVGSPLAAAKWTGIPARKAFRIASASWNYYVVALLLGLSLWPFAHELVLRQHEHGWFTFDADKLDRARNLIVQWQQIPLIWTFMCVSIVPAIAEELFFRGFLVSALLSGRQSPRMAVITSAAIFGAFHVIVMEGMLFERFLPTMFLGLILGWIAVRSGSVLPGIILHAVHNGFVVVTAYYKEEIAARGWGLGEQTHLPMAWLAGAAICVAAALAFAYGVRPKQDSPSSQ
jgi:ABC-2 type transport system permease protein/sodium transport system permease protein